MEGRYFEFEFTHGTGNSRQPATYRLKRERQRCRINIHYTGAVLT